MLPLVFAAPINNKERKREKKEKIKKQKKTEVLAIKNKFYNLM